LGFVSWTLMNVGPDLATASIFEDELEADNAAGWYKENQAALALGKPQVTRGPIVIHYVAEHVPAGYGLLWRCAFRAGGAEQAAQRLRDEFVPLMGGMPQFASYEAIDAGGSNVLSLCAFKSRDASDAAMRRTVSWVNENLAGLVSNPPEVIVGEIKLRSSRAAAENASAASLHADA
jgi:hypothetical protein